MRCNFFNARQSSIRGWNDVSKATVTSKNLITTTNESRHVRLFQIIRNSKSLFFAKKWKKTKDKIHVVKTYLCKLNLGIPST